MVIIQVEPANLANCLGCGQKTEYVYVSIAIYQPPMCYKCAVEYTYLNLVEWDSELETIKNYQAKCKLSRV